MRIKSRDRDPIRTARLKAVPSAAWLGVGAAVFL